MPNISFAQTALYNNLAQEIINNQPSYRECFGFVKGDLLDTEFLEVWCTNQELHEDIKKIERAIDFLEFKQGDFHIGFHGIQDCVFAEAPSDCILSTFKEVQKHARDTAQITIDTYKDKGNSEDATAILNKFSGEYRSLVRNTLMDGREYESEDLVRIIPITELAAYIQIHLNFSNGHACHLSGIFEYKSDESFVFHDDSYESVCFLQAKAHDGKFIFTEKNESCRKACGTKGSLDSLTILSTERDVTADLETVKNTRKYRKSVSRYMRTKTY